MPNMQRATLSQQSLLGPCRPLPSPTGGQSRWYRSRCTHTHSQVTRLSPGGGTGTVSAIRVGHPDHPDAVGHRDHGMRARHHRHAAPPGWEVTACTRPPRHTPAVLTASFKRPRSRGGAGVSWTRRRAQFVRAPRPGLACHWSICSRVHVGVRPTIVGSGIRPSARYVSTVRIEIPGTGDLGHGQNVTHSHVTSPNSAHSSGVGASSSDDSTRIVARTTSPRRTSTVSKDTHGHPRQRCRSRRRSRR